MIITDISPYREQLEEFDLTDEEKLQLLNDLCNIVQNLMDRKYGAHQWGTLKERPIKIPPRTSSNRKNE